MGRVIEAFAQFFDDAGDPLVKGWLKFLEANSNNTYKDTFADANLQIPNANPLQLDPAGRCPNVFGTGLYRVISYTNDIVDDIEVPGSMVQMFDPVITAGTVTGGGGGTGFAEWDALETYNIGDIVTYNTKYYRSLVNGNIGLNPIIETSSWENIQFVPIWNDAVYYSEGQCIKYGINLYLSLQNLNLNHVPGASPEWWRAVATGIHSPQTKIDDYEILPTERDHLFILGTATPIAKQFDLPVMDATTDGFRVAIYNASNYNLTITSLSGTIWIDTGTLVIPKGTYIEVMYIHSITAWIPFGNAGTLLGGQIIGSATKYITAAYIGLLHDGVTIPDDEHMHFGDDQDGTIYFDSGANALILETAAAIDLYFAPAGTILWEMLVTGEFIPGPLNLLADIGHATRPVHDVYINNDVFIADSGVLNLGSDDDLQLYFDGSISRILGSNGQMYLGTLTAHNLSLFVNNLLVVQFDTAKDAYFSGSIYLADSEYAIFGNDTDLTIVHTGVNGSLNNITGAFYAQVAGSSVLRLQADLSTYCYGILTIAGTTFTMNTGYTMFYNGVANYIQAAAGYLDFKVSGGTALRIEADKDLIAYKDLSVQANLAVTGTLTLGGTLLLATIAEINSRCYGIPESEIETWSGSKNTFNSVTTIDTINLGTVNAGSYAIITANVDCVVNYADDPTNVHIQVQKDSGTAGIYLGGTSGGDLYTGTFITPDAPAFISADFTLQLCGILYINTTGTLILELNGMSTPGRAYYSASRLEVLWIKST